ncbi:hypothetical protein H4219_006300 [Mycoemilia scoparia]|uniref:Uncharacterized protein n=1 Tax=Mycoemilia scoparia TaxID=417184 RepID=A0A9W7ZTA2_9FUNG|nr:hypothetical protein H4219_006300 [Mycoemilia scoparia]
MTKKHSERPSKGKASSQANSPESMRRPPNYLQQNEGQQNPGVAENAQRPRNSRAGSSSKRVSYALEPDYMSESGYTSDDSVQLGGSPHSARYHHHHRHHRQHRSPKIRDIDSDAVDAEDAVEGQPKTVRGRQHFMNDWHMFGFRPWKSALYKKSRSVTRAAFMALHSPPDRTQRIYRSPGNILWTLLFGWWMALVCMAAGSLLTIIPFGGREYSRVVFGLASYLFWPFGRSVERIKTKSNNNPETPSTAIATASGALRTSCNETGDHEVVPLLGSGEHPPRNLAKFSGLGRAFYYLLFLVAINPVLLVVSVAMWLFVFTIPMGKLTFTLSRYLWRDPLSLHFNPKFKDASAEALYPASSARQSAQQGHGGSSDSDEEAGDSAQDNEAESSEEEPVYHPPPTTLLCTNHAMGLYYYKYTVDGVNILFIDLLFVALYVLTASFILKPIVGEDSPLVNPQLLFCLCIVSIIPLAYLIGQAVSSISAQSTLGMGAVINATFGSIVEIILYAIALNEGRSELVEGALIGSFLSGMLLMPGTSMIAGGYIYKVQRFNAKSAGVTATLIIMSIIAAFAPTLFYQTFGEWELVCNDEVPTGSVHPSTISTHCKQLQPPAYDNQFYKERVRPFMYLCAAILPTAYLIGLWFTLRTHSKHIYAPQQRLSTTLRSVSRSIITSLIPEVIRHVLPTRGPANQQELPGINPSYTQHGSSTPQVFTPTPQISTTEPACEDASASQCAPKIRRHRSTSHVVDIQAPFVPDVPALNELPLIPAADPDDLPPDFELLAASIDNEASSGDGGHGGHDAPNWSKTKSAIILCVCTVVFALIAEVLVKTVDYVMKEIGMDDRYKLMGITVFSIAPNVTEFVNAIAFAIKDNIALSIEIGNAYTIQVALLQIPALVAFSAFFGPGSITETLSKVFAFIEPPQTQDNISKHVFTLMFPRWDVITVLFSVFLLTYMLIEGKANYFKGSILCLSYLVWVASYCYEPIHP